MSPSASSSGTGRTPIRVAVVGNPGSRRVELLREALAGLGAPEPNVLSYAELLKGGSTLAEVVGEGDILRIESPDRDFETERALIALGADEAEDEGTSIRIGRSSALALEFDRGRILYPRQWYLGFLELLRLIDRQRDACPSHRIMNAPLEIAAMFDKPRCRDQFEEVGIPCPEGLGMIDGYDDLRSRMDRSGLGRVFVKLRHGSSASGVVALETVGRRVRATSTAERVDDGAEVRLYNTRSIRRIDNEAEVAILVDALGRLGAYAERWVPKAGIDGGTFDLRVVVIDGRASHTVARVSRSPMTNLHLINRRGDPEAVRARMAPLDWSAALRSSEAAAGLFPESLYAGVDLAIAAGFRRHAILEVNAFGDLLPGIFDRKMDTYTAELAAIRGPAAEGAA